MTRFARMGKKKHHEAAEWGQFEDPSKDKSKIAKTESDETGIERKQTKKAKKQQRKENDAEKGFGTSEVVKSDISHTEPQEKKQKSSQPSNDNDKTNNKQFELTHKKKKKKLSTSEHKIQSDSTTSFKKTFSGESKRDKKLEKQREARRRRRAKQKGVTCFHCRELGHRAADCPQTKCNTSGIGVCYKCGSTSHITKHCKVETPQDNPFPYAKCFICGEKGHLSSSCPDNPKGLYPEGGACKGCGSVEHLMRNCPELASSKGNKRKHDKHNSADAELDSDDNSTKPALHKKTKKQKVVKF